MDIFPRAFFPQADWTSWKLNKLGAENSLQLKRTITHVSASADVKGTWTAVRTFGSILWINLQNAHQEQSDLSEVVWHNRPNISANLHTPCSGHALLCILSILGLPWLWWYCPTSLLCGWSADGWGKEASGTHDILKRPSAYNLSRYTFQVEAQLKESLELALALPGCCHTLEAQVRPKESLEFVLALPGCCTLEDQVRPKEQLEFVVALPGCHTLEVQVRPKESLEFQPKESHEFALYTCWMLFWAS